LLGLVVLLYLLTSPRQHHWFVQAAALPGGGGGGGGVRAGAGVERPERMGFAGLPEQPPRGRDGRLQAPLFPDVGGHAAPVGDPLPVRAGNGRAGCVARAAGWAPRWTTARGCCWLSGAVPILVFSARQFSLDRQDQLAGARLLVVDHPGGAVPAGARGRPATAAARPGIVGGAVAGGGSGVLDSEPAGAGRHERLERLERGRDPGCKGRSRRARRRPPDLRVRPQLQDQFSDAFLPSRTAAHLCPRHLWRQGVAVRLFPAGSRPARRHGHPGGIRPGRRRPGPGAAQALVRFGGARRHGGDPRLRQAHAAGGDLPR
jgi:hypothetical protein